MTFRIVLGNLNEKYWDDKYLSNTYLKPCEFDSKVLKLKVNHDSSVHENREFWQSWDCFFVSKLYLRYKEVYSWIYHTLVSHEENLLSSIYSWCLRRMTMFAWNSLSLCLHPRIINRALFPHFSLILNSKMYEYFVPQSWSKSFKRKKEKGNICLMRIYNRVDII